MTENTSLFDSEEVKRTRKVAYKKSKCKDGLLHIRLTPENADSVKKYCRLHNVNCSAFVNSLILDRMKELAETQYDDLTKEELIALVKRLESEHD